jgi:ketosteroid isomerase-like protein
MAEVDAFLASTMPRLTQADTALHNGDAGPRKAIWSRDDPVTLFGAAVTKSGWGEIGPTFDWLASSFSNCESFDYEVIAAGASGDLAYIAGIEHTTTRVGEAAPTTYSLRVTTVFRREDGEWNVVHRHGDPVPESASARDVVGHFNDERDAR